MVLNMTGIVVKAAYATVAEEDGLIAISGGCVCCAFGGDLIGALEDILAMRPRPDHVLVDGRTLRAADLQRRTVVVEVWATWCPFCMKQNPHIQKLHEASRDSGLLVLTFALDQAPEVVRQYMDKRGYTFAAALNGPQVQRWFGKRRSLPELYVVDRAGRVVFREQGEMFPEDIAALTRFAAR